MSKRHLEPGDARPSSSYPGREDVSHALTALGRRTARSLLAAGGRVPRGGVHWSDALQLAADRTDQHQEILRIADELHIAAPDIRSGAGIRVYVLSTLPSVRSEAALSFLIGMFEAVATRPGP